MARADIQVGIGGDASGLRRELAQSRGNVNGWAKEVEGNVKRMRLNPFAGLLAGFSIYRLAGTAAKIMDDAGAVKKLAEAAKLPTAQYLVLSEAAKAAGVSTQKLGEMLQAYSAGERTLQSVAEAVGLIGANALVAGGGIRSMAAAIDALARSDAVIKRTKEGVGRAGGFGMAAALASMRYGNTGNQEALADLVALFEGDREKVMLQLLMSSPAGFLRARKGPELDATVKEYFDKPRRERQDLAARDREIAQQLEEDRKYRNEEQGRAWSNSVNTFNRTVEDKNKEKADTEEARALEAKMEADERDVAQGEERYRKYLLVSARAQSSRDSAIDSITVGAPASSSRLSAIGGFVGGRMTAENEGRMRAERMLKLAEIQAEYTKQIAANTEG